MRIIKQIITVSVILFSLIYIIINNIHIPKHSFNSLKDLKQYANCYPESPLSDNNNWTNPDFTSFYYSIQPSFLTKALLKLGLRQTCLWDPAHFKKLLTELIDIRKEVKQNFTEKLKLSMGSKIFIWGDLQASFHSLIRGLTELEKRKIITNELELQDKKNYMVFLGDAVSRAPYSIETLHTIALLIHKNPKNIIYLKGRHESHKYWENFNMNQQLHITLSQDRHNQLKFNQLINNFFETLPLYLSVSHTDYKDETIYFAHYKVSDDLLDNTNIPYIILGEQRFDVMKETKGLEFIGNIYASAQWSVLSCPSMIYQQFFNFHYDVFAELSIGRSLSHSILTLNYHDLRKNKTNEQNIGINNIFSHIYFDPVFGTQLPNQKSIIDGKTIINLGSTMSLTGVIGPLGRDTKAGLETAIQNFNNNIENNNRIKLIIMDDGYVPRIALSNVQKLNEKYNATKIIIPTGTPTLDLYMNMIRQETLTGLFPYTGGPQFRASDIRNMIHFRASYADEIQTSINYFINEYGIKTFAFFYQNDGFGIPIAEAAHKELKKHGITKWIDLPHLRTQTNFDLIVNKLKTELPEAIGCFSSHFPTIELLNSIGSEFFIDRTLFGVSFLYSEAFQKFLDDRGINFSFSSVVPDPKISTIQIAKEYIELINYRGFPMSLASFEGFIAGELFIDAINRIASPYTKEKLIQYFENLNNYEFKGLTLTFNPKHRDLLQPIWFRIDDHKWLEYKRDISK